MSQLQRLVTEWKAVQVATNPLDKMDALCRYGLAGQAVRESVPLNELRAGVAVDGCFVSVDLLTPGRPIKVEELH